MDLAEVPIDELVAEVSRRMHCLDKPEKRVIMVGKGADANLDVDPDIQQLCQHHRIQLSKILIGP